MPRTSACGRSSAAAEVARAARRCRAESPRTVLRYDRHQIAASFDRRAGRYTESSWHRRSAERLIELCQLRPGDTVLDAGTGTGFAALAAARAVGGRGRVCAVDISPGMLQEARTAVQASGLTNLELIEADALHLRQFGAGTFDVVTCATGLLYMPVTEALREWHRLLKPGGRIGFSAMAAGSPPAARLFRECAAACGIALRDPLEALGSRDACQRALESAGFNEVEVADEVVELSANDLSHAWDSNAASLAYRDVERLDAEQRQAMKGAFENAMARSEREHPGAMGRAVVLYARGRVTKMSSPSPSPTG